MFKSIIEQFVFFPQKELEKTPSQLGIEYQDIYLNMDIYKIHGWFIKNKVKKDMHTNIKDKVILFLHGNAGNISFRLNYIKIFYDLGFSLMFFDYPGFGLSQGIPNENNCVNSGELFYNFLIENKNFKHENIIFYGESIGGACVCNLANKLNAKHLILQSTFTDIKMIIKNLSISNYLNYFIEHLGFETLNYLKYRHKINLIQKKMKSMVIHSNNDEIINISNAQELSKYSNEFIITNGTHSNIEFNNDLIYKIVEFIKN
jgi:uncharacterized protein